MPGLVAAKCGASSCRSPDQHTDAPTAAKRGMFLGEGVCSGRLVRRPESSSPIWV